MTPTAEDFETLSAPTRTGQTVCVTGAGGSIGSEICRQLVFDGVRELRMVGLTESALYRLREKMEREKLHEDCKLVYLLGSVCNDAFMLEVLDGCDLVIHAGAHKHVPICESNPLEAISNNVGGTLSLAYAAIAKHVPRFVFISTDKAVYPTSVMGKTKRAAELMLQAIPPCATKFIIVRFGNVLDSDGSVLPLWRKQIAQGGPLTLTDEKCERYFMSIPDAVELVLGAAEMNSGLYVFDMGKPYNMGEMARSLMREMGKVVPIVTTGLRTGEKLVEELTQGGTRAVTSHRCIWRIEEDGAPRTLDLEEWIARMLRAAERRERQRAVEILNFVTDRL